MTDAPPPSDFVVVLVTVPDAETGAKFGRVLVEEALAACVNIVPGLRSLYRFEGRLCDDAEALCLMKTRKSLYPALRDRILALHPYAVPEIIALPVVEGNAGYLAWLADSTATSGPGEAP